jgi:branched-chain amino acid transport system permease protein
VKHVRIWGLVALVALIILIPLVVGDPAFTSMGIYVLLFTCAGIAWNLFSGFTGYISLGQGVYIGIGAYFLALLCQRYDLSGGIGPFLLMPLSGLVASLFSVPIGWIALRTRRYAFVVITIAIFFLFQLLASNLPSLTGGTRGIYLPAVQWSPDVYDLPFYYLAFVITMLAIITTWWLRYSKFGLGLFAIRDDENRARSLGVPTGRYKLFAYVLSAFFIGMVGAQIVYYTGIVYPSYAFNVNFDVSVAVIAFFGGIGTVSGPIVGGFLIGPLQQELNLQFSSIAAGLELVLFGAILLIIVALLPEGIVPSLSKYGKKLIARYNRKQFKEVLLLPEFIPPSRISLNSESYLTSSETILNSVSSLVPQEIFVQSDIIEPSKKHGALNIPRRLTARPLPVPVDIRNTRFRSQRLVSLSHQDSIKMQEHGTTSTLISWRCPNCQRPFLLNGNQCYCPKCGFTRPLFD